MDFFGFFTEGHGWVYASLISTVIGAFNTLVNQYFKQPGGGLVLCSRIMTVLILTPYMIFFVKWPDAPMFYIGVFLTAVFGGLSDIRTFNCIAKFGGGAISRVGPITVFVAFIFWFFIDHALLLKYINHPLQTAGICATVFGCVYFSMRMNKNSFSKEAMNAMMPALLGYAISMLLNKYAMRLTHNYEGMVFCYMYVQSLALLPMVIGYLYVKDKDRKELSLKSTIFNKDMMKASITTSVLWIIALIFMTTAMISIPSPAYHSAIGQMSPVIIAIIYYFAKHKEEGDVWSGFGVVACAIAMSLLVVR